MRNLLCALVVVVAAQSSSGQIRKTNTAAAAKTVFEGQTARVRLAPQLTTTIRLPEAVNSVVLGIPIYFRPSTHRTNLDWYSSNR
jgi:hypothetical protein